MAGVCVCVAVKHGHQNRKSIIHQQLNIDQIGYSPSVGWW
jgi:hypothetical protein